MTSFLINDSSRQVGAICTESTASSNRFLVFLFVLLFTSVQSVNGQIREVDSTLTFHGTSPLKNTFAKTWVQELQTIEVNVQPPVLQSGKRQYQTLPDYYWASNKQLRQHVDGLVLALKEARPEDCCGLTLVAGTAGVGKTFIKAGLLGEGSVSTPVEKFDIREWYIEFSKEGLAEYQADIKTQDHAMCQLLKLTRAGRVAFASRVAAIEKDFLLMDSLDEVHPDDYLFLLQTLQDLVDHQLGNVKHAFVFGRPLVFREYWHRCCDDSMVEGLHCFVLNPPALRTDGDLLVSSWNYHCWKYKLRSLSPSGNTIELPLEVYEQWQADGFPSTPNYEHVVCLDRQALRSDIQDTLSHWASAHPCVAAVLGNLAGNSMVREIVRDSVMEGKEYSEKRFKEEFFAKWLERDTLSGDRPSRLKPRDLDLYVKLLEAVAIKYADSAIEDKDGFFEVSPEDEVRAKHEGSVVTVSVEQLLNRSGLVNLDAQRLGDAKYRFEPVWFHRLLIQKHVDRSNSEDQKNRVVSASASES